MNQRPRFDRTLAQEWSRALNAGDLSAIRTLLVANPGLGYLHFLPKEKLSYYHSDDYYPLLWALWNGRTDIAKLLVEKGEVDVNREGHGCLPFLIATAEQSDYLLAHGADINRYCENGGTPLQWATFHCDLDRVLYLVDRGADVRIAKPNSGENNLMLLMQPWTCHPDEKVIPVAKVLLDNGLDVNAKTFSGLKGEPIRNHGNDNLVSEGCLTALHLAAGQGRLELTRFLLERGADRNAKTVSRRRTLKVEVGDVIPFERFEGKTPLQWAHGEGHEDVERVLERPL